MALKDIEMTAEANSIRDNVALTGQRGDNTA